MTVFVEKRRFLREFPKSLYGRISGNTGEIYAGKADVGKSTRCPNSASDMQRCLILRFYHELKIKEIAQITNTVNATVKSRLGQGMEK